MRKLTKTAITVATMATMILGTVASIQADETKVGWVGSGNNYEYYNEKGEKQTDIWVKAGEKWYFLDEDGKMAVNAFIRTDAFTGESEVLSKTGVHDNLGIDDIDDDSSFYYVNNNGEMVTGWQEIATNQVYLSPNSELGKSLWYYFGTSGAMYTNAWILSGEDWYAVGQNGQMEKNSILPNNLKETIADDSEYYVDSNGKMIRGWYKTKDADKKTFGKKDLYIYAYEDGVLAKREWVKDGSKWYFIGTGADEDVDESGDDTLKIQAYYNTMEGRHQLSLNPYDEDDAEGDKILNSDYVMLSNKIVRWTNHDGDSKWFWLQDDGEMLANRWKEFEDDYYVYANASGELELNGVKKVNNRYYYFNGNAVCDYKVLNTVYDYVVEYKEKDGDSDVTKYLFYNTDSKDTDKVSNNIDLSNLKKSGVIAGNEVYSFGERSVKVGSMTDLQLILAYAAGTKDLLGKELTVYKLRNSQKIEALVQLTTEKDSKSANLTSITLAMVKATLPKAAITSVATGSAIGTNAPSAITGDNISNNDTRMSVSVKLDGSIGKRNEDGSLNIGAELMLEFDANAEVKLDSVPSGAKVYNEIDGSARTETDAFTGEIATGKYLTLNNKKSTIYVTKTGRYRFTVTTKEDGKNAVEKTMIIDVVDGN